MSAIAALQSLGTALGQVGSAGLGSLIAPALVARGVVSPILNNYTDGAIGRGLGGYFGEKIGKFFGGSGQSTGKRIGQKVGTAVLGFKKGGRVKRTGRAQVHKGEYVLPKGVAPTKKQKKRVEKRQKKRFEKKRVQKKKR